MTTKRILPDPSLDWAVPLSVVALIAESEGCRLTSYRCPAGMLTIGWGQTGDDVYEGETITQQQADAMLCLAIKRFAAQVRTRCTVETNINELGALVSLAYNIGIGALAKSAVMKFHNAGNKTAAARAFAPINKFLNPKTKKLEVSSGLIRRRAAEAALYLTPVVTATDAGPAQAPAPAPLPQAVAAPATPSTHPVTLMGIGTAASGALGALSDLTTQASSVGTTAQTVATNAQVTVSSVQTAASTAHDILHTVANFVGVSPTMLLCGLAVAVGTGIVAFVYKLHTEGRI
jgi:lysozyme